jgi:hypothetical protein
MKSIAVVAGLATAILLGGADAPKNPPAARPGRFTQTPTFEQIVAAMPPGSYSPDSTYIAMIGCKAAEDRSLEGCRVVQQAPGSEDFGRASLSLAPQYRLKPVAEGGYPAGAAVFIPFVSNSFDKAPDWLRKPTADNLMAVWPVEAVRRGLGGGALIDCLINLQGSLFDCVVIDETPSGQQFGAAAIALTPQFLMKPGTRHGRPVVSAIQIPINFKWPGPPPEGGVSTTPVLPVAIDWPEAPTYADVVSAYPAKARAAHLGGKAALNCILTAQGRLSRCRTLFEQPSGQGFADAARQLSKLFRAPTMIGDKSVRGATVDLPVAFDEAMLTGAHSAGGKARWTAVPSVEDTKAAFGKVALTGPARAGLTCMVQSGGSVSECKVTREDPAGRGVGDAALALTPNFRLSTWTTEGLPTVGGTIDIPLRYEPPAAPSKAEAGATAH